MQKLLLLMMFIFCGLISKESLAQINTMGDTLAIQNMLGDLKQLIDRNLDSTLVLSKEIEQRAAKIKYRNGIWEAQMYRGKTLFKLGYPDSSKVLLEKVLKETQEQKCRLEEIKVHLALAEILQDDYNFTLAVENLLQAEKIIKDSDPFDLRFEILNSLATTHRKMKDYTGALKYFDVLENSYFNQMDALHRYALFQNKGNVYAAMKKYDKTEEFFNKAYNEITKTNSPSNQAAITYNLGALFYSQKRYNEAQEYITKSLETYLKIGARIKIERCYRVLGAIYYDRKEYYKAKEYYNLAMKIAQEIKSPSAIMGNYNNLYLTYWNLGYYRGNIEDLTTALSYYQKYNLIKDSLYKIETTAKVLELEKQYETEKKNTQITLLEKENQHKEDQILIQHAQHNYLILTIILVSITLGVFIYFFYYYKKVNKLLHIQSKSILDQKNQLYEQNIKLQKSLNTQNKLFSIIAHDLRSPLASIFNISSLIGFYIQDKEYDSLEEAVKMMDQKTDQILDLTDNLLSWAKSQTENLQPLFESLSLSGIFSECIELYGPIAAEKHISIDCLEQKDLVVWADRNMVKTICRNLVNNAIKFTHESGKIIVWYEANGPFAQICIKDSGIGIEQVKLDSLFEINSEKTTPDTAGQMSTGLGLSVCKEFVDAMRGKIWVESETGIGSQFTIELLLYDPQIHQSRHKHTQKSVIASPISN
ncbi:MAG: tetratricopeptide repeat-containing sensor histidine kinase [Prolixibacteraceae bacterium]|nr:tetratricopeptide repeat-containing sensor histidine kinase [Prolixibacteraceae bacterium]